MDPKVLEALGTRYIDEMVEKPLHKERFLQGIERLSFQELQMVYELIYTHLAENVNQYERYFGVYSRWYRGYGQNFFNEMVCGHYRCCGFDTCRSLHAYSIEVVDTLLDTGMNDFQMRFESIRTILHKIPNLLNRQMFINGVTNMLTAFPLFASEKCNCLDISAHFRLRMLIEMEKALIKAIMRKDEKKILDRRTDWVTKQTLSAMNYSLNDTFNSIRLILSGYEMEMSETQAERFLERRKKNKALYDGNIRKARNFLASFNGIFSSLGDENVRYWDIDTIVANINSTLLPYYCTKLKIKGLNEVPDTEEFGQVEINPFSFSKVIFILFENAIHAGADTVIFTFGTLESHQALWVYNNGRNMNAEEEQLCFSPHYSGTGSLGLGLNIARKECISHGVNIYLAETNPVAFCIEFAPVGQNHLKNRNEDELEKAFTAG